MISLTFRQLSECLSAGRLICESRRVDVWLLSTRVDSEQRTAYSAVLSCREQEKASHFRFVADQDRSIVARGGLRHVLSRYCAKGPAELQFVTGPYGKPQLSQPSVPINFNVSHAGDYVLIGVTKDAECGVDIERPHREISEHEIASRFFCRREVEWMQQAESGFMRLWTMKEAVLKAVGHGLSIPLNCVDVADVAAGGESRVLVRTSRLESRQVWLKELKLLESYIASVAAVGGEFTVRIMPQPLSAT